MNRFGYVILFTYLKASAFLTRAQVDISTEAIMEAHLLDIREAYLTNLQSPTTTAAKIEVAESAFKRSLDVTRPLPIPSALFDPNDEDHCGFCLTNLRLGDNGTISSENFPSPYPNDQQCLWLLQTMDDSRIRLTCDTIHLESCGPLGRDSPQWNDYLIISPLWTFKKSYVYCGHATTLTSLTHTSLCDKLAVTFRSNGNSGNFKGFHCIYEAIE